MGNPSTSHRTLWTDPLLVLTASPEQRHLDSLALRRAMRGFIVTARRLQQPNLAAQTGFHGPWLPRLQPATQEASRVIVKGLSSSDDRSGPPPQGRSVLPPAMARFISTCLHARQIGRLSWSESCYSIPHGIVLSNRGLLGSSGRTLHLVIFCFCLLLAAEPFEEPVYRLWCAWCFCAVAWNHDRCLIRLHINRYRLLIFRPTDCDRQGRSLHIPVVC